MPDLFWLPDVQIEKLKPFFPRSHGVSRVDGKRVLSGIVFINRNGLRWRDAPAEYGPPKTLYNGWVHWGRLGVVARMLVETAAEGQNTETVMSDVAPVVRQWSENHRRGYLKAHRTASSLRDKKGGAAPRARAFFGRIWREKDLIRWIKSPDKGWDLSPESSVILK